MSLNSSRPCKSLNSSRPRIPYLHHHHPKIFCILSLPMPPSQLAWRISDSWGEEFKSMGCLDKMQRTICYAALQHCLPQAKHQGDDTKQVWFLENFNTVGNWDCPGRTELPWQRPVSRTGLRFQSDECSRNISSRLRRSIFSFYFTFFSPGLMMFAWQHLQ